MIRAIPYTSLWLGTVLWIVASGILLFALGWQLNENYLFAHFSASTTATVEKRYSRTTHGRHGDSTSYYLQYHYQVGPVLANANSGVDYATYASTGVGASLPVLYLTDKIGHNRINLPAENSDRTRDLVIILALTATDLIVGAWIMIYYVRRNRLYRELFARGVQCQGLVTDVNCDLVGKTRSPRFYLSFTFRDQQGGDWDGRTWYLKPGDEVRWHAQMPVSVYYDSRDAKKFTVDLVKREA